MTQRHRRAVKAYPHRRFRWGKALLILLLTLVIGAVAAVGLTRAANAIRTRIDEPTGIQEGFFVTLGGARQYIQIRGESAANPVILSVHGGPGNPMTTLSYVYQTALESSYTIVQWEQRGCGRTYYENSNRPQTPLSAELVLTDMDELIDYLRTRFAQEKIIVMGHSWGTVLGSLYAQAHPEKVAAFLSVSQVVDLREALLLTGSAAQTQAKERSTLEEQQDLALLIDELSAMQGYDEGFHARFARMVGYGARYMPYAAARPSYQTAWEGITSPNTSLQDVLWYWMFTFQPQKQGQLQSPLLRACYEFDAYQHASYQMPVYFIAGTCDWITPCALIEQYADQVQALDKAMMTLEGLGHTPQLESPLRFCEAVKRLLGRMQ